MKSYRTYPSEMITFQDRTTGATVHQLTNYKCNSTHPYFTDDGWYDNDRRMLFISERENARNIYSIEIASGEISQLTNMPAGDPGLTSPMFVNKKVQRDLLSLSRMYLCAQFGNIGEPPSLYCAQRILPAAEHVLPVMENPSSLD